MSHDLHGGATKQLPLNSKRLTANNVKRIARALDVPSEATLDEVRLLIEGKVQELGHEPRNTQVMVEETERGTKLTLLDHGGVFVTVEPQEPPVTTDSSEEPPVTEDDGLDEVTELRQTIATSEARIQTLEEEVVAIRRQLQEAKERNKELWRLNCAQLSEFDAALTAKDEEIIQLQQRLLDARVTTPTTVVGESNDDSVSLRGVPSITGHHRRGRAPPISLFSGEDAELRLDDWLPSMERAKAWNGWTTEECLLQMAGHLQGRALLEWNLLKDDEKDTMEKAVGALRNRLDEGGRALAAQDFRHSLQKEGETVSNYIRRLESTFKIAYGRDAMAAGTRDTLLHGQFQEGLRYELMRSPAVSGASTYRELCLAAKNEEKRLLELKKRQLYRKTPISGGRELATGRSTINRPQEEIPPNESSGNRRCFQCGKVGHLAKECRMRKSESRGTTSGGSTTRKITTTTEAGLTSYLYQSDSSEVVHKRMSIFNLRRFAYNIRRFIECSVQHKFAYFCPF